MGPLSVPGGTSGRPMLVAYTYSSNSKETKAELKAEDHVKSAMKYMQHNDYKAAEEEVLEAIKINPDYAEAYSDLGFIYVKLGRNDEAKKALLTAINLDPDNEDAYNNLGMLYMKEDDFDGAECLFRKAISVYPPDFNPHSNLGVVYFKKGMYEEAEKVLQRAIKINPGRPGPRKVLGVVNLHLERWDVAVSYLMEEAQLNPNSDEAIWSSKTLEEMSKPANDAKWFPAKIKVGKDPSKAAYSHCLLGKAFHKLGRDEDAVRELKTAITLYPKESIFFSNLGIVYVVLKKYSAAGTVFQNALKLDDTAVDSHNGLGMVYYEMDDLDGAEKEFKKAIRLDPNDSIAYFNLAAVYGRQGRSDEAAGQLEETIRANPSSNKADEARDFLEQMKKNPDVLKRKLPVQFTEE